MEQEIVDNALRKSQSNSILHKFAIQLCSSQPESNPIAFFVHMLIQFLLLVYYAYFSLRMDRDPEDCFASQLSGKNDPITMSAYELMTENSSTYDTLEAVGREFRAIFDALFYLNVMLICSVVARILACPVVKPTNRTTW